MKTWRVASIVAVCVLTVCVGVVPAAAKERKPHPKVPEHKVLAAKSAAPPRSAWAKVLNRVNSDGTVPKTAALQAFALAMGPVPGVHVPKGPTGNLRAGGGAVRWVLGHFDELTPAQQAAVQRRLSGTPAPHRGEVGRSAPVKSPKTPPIVTVIKEMQARYDGPLGPLSIPVEVSYIGPDGTAAAAAEPVNSTGGLSGAPAKCQMEITPLGQAATGGDLETVVAHELFHCYQAVWLGLDRYYADPAWEMEGAASWAGINVTPDLPGAGLNYYSLWLSSTGMPLFQRSYSAIGFYGAVAQQGVDLWSNFPDFFHATTNDARYHVLADAAGDGLLDAWGPSYWMAADRGPAWLMTGTGVPPAGAYYGHPGSLAVADGGQQAVHAAPYTVGMYWGTPTADVTEVQIAGHARLADQGGFDSGELTDVFLCTKTSGECKCPDDTDTSGGSNGLPPSIQQVDGTLLLGLTGATDGTKGSVTGLSLDQWCKHHRRAANACEVLDTKTIDRITGLHITLVKLDGDTCVYGDLTAPPNPLLNATAEATSQALQGAKQSISSGAGLTVRLRAVPTDPEPQVADYVAGVSAELGVCDAGELIGGVNGASLVCLNGALEHVAVVRHGRMAYMIYLPSGNSATHAQGNALGQAANDTL